MTERSFIYEPGIAFFDRHPLNFYSALSKYGGDNQLVVQLNPDMSFSPEIKSFLALTGQDSIFAILIGVTV